MNNAIIVLSARRVINTFIKLIILNLLFPSAVASSNLLFPSVVSSSIMRRETSHPQFRIVEPNLYYCRVSKIFGCKKRKWLLISSLYKNTSSFAFIITNEWDGHKTWYKVIFTLCIQVGMSHDMGWQATLHHSFISWMTFVHAKSTMYYSYCSDPRM